MHPIISNTLAIILGFIIGSAVNMGIIMISGSIIPPPNGADITTMEGLQATMHLFEPKHFLMPFLAHAIGTLAGAFLAARIASKHKAKFGLTIGFIFLAGGIVSVVMLKGPMWFNITDLVLAYIPMAYIGSKLASRSTK